MVDLLSLSGHVSMELSIPKNTGKILKQSWILYVQEGMHHN